jgi:hypothetical protein
VFAATGWLFGREIHRERAVRAEQQADDAETRALENLKDATAGKALYAQVKSEKSRRQRANSSAPAPTGQYQPMGPGSPGGPTADDDSIDRLAEVADALFPELARK